MQKPKKAAVKDRYRAQELAYEAMQTADPARSQSLFDQALELDPRCVDALLAGNRMPDSPAKRIEYLEEVVEIAFEDLGGEAFVQENRGYFWGLLETRPYMRVRSYLAMEYQDADRLAEAIAEYEALLDLNPNDNQGIRHCLLGAYMEHGDFAGARALIKQNSDYPAATFAWAHVLERFVAGDMEQAGRALMTARQVNPYVEAYASGLKPLPGEHPGFYGQGDESEAEFCCFILGAAWRDNPGFLFWLADQQKGTAYIAGEKAGRNDPCPCGSGKKYKKCCLGKPDIPAPAPAGLPQGPAIRHMAPGTISTAGESFFHGFRQFIGDREFESEEEMNALLQEYQQQVNRQPLASFHGLSPEQMRCLLYEPFDSPDIVEFPDILAESPTGPLAELFTMLAGAIGTDGLKPTATGNLPRQVVREIALAYMGEKGYAEYTKYRGINSEPDFTELDITRFTAEEAGLISKYKGRFILSRECRELMGKDGMRVVYPRLFRSFVQRVDWPYADRYQELSFIQDSFAFTLYLLERFGGEWHANSFYVDEFINAFPHLVEEIEPMTYSTRKDVLLRMYSFRCLKRFAGYAGLVEIKATPGDLLEKDFKLRKTPLFNQVVKFHVS